MAPFLLGSMVWPSSSPQLSSLHGAGSSSPGRAPFQQGRPGPDGPCAAPPRGHHGARRLSPSSAAVPFLHGHGAPLLFSARGQETPMTSTLLCPTPHFPLLSVRRRSSSFPPWHPFPAAAQIDEPPVLGANTGSDCPSRAPFSSSMDCSSSTPLLSFPWRPHSFHRKTSSRPSVAAELQLRPAATAPRIPYARAQAPFLLPLSTPSSIPAQRRCSISSPYSPPNSTRSESPSPMAEPPSSLAA
jgi:hypothetical protein